jgi:hypothetical protein
MLVQREKYLIHHVYKDMYDKKIAAMKKVKAFLSTHSWFLKYAAELCSLPKGFVTNDETGRCLLVDELQQLPAIDLLACLPRVEWRGLLGDDMQQNVKGSQGRISAGKMTVQHKQRDPQEIAAFDWLKGLPDIWKFHLQQTYRLGRTVVSLLKQVFQNQLPDLVSIRNTDMLVLLTLFNDTEFNFDNKNGEVTSSYSFFASVLLQVTFEIVFYVIQNWDTVRHDDVEAPRHNIRILIIGYLLGPLEFLEAFLIRSLQEACRSLHAALGLGAPPPGFQIYDYLFLSRAGILQLAGAQKSGGMTCTVAILFVPKRNKRDTEWCGDMLKLHLLYLALTRATDRVYSLLEDMPNAHPRTEHQQTESMSGPHLGEDSSSLMKKQEHWTRLILQGVRLWNTTLEITTPQAVAITRTSKKSLTTTPSYFKSNVFARSITRGGCHASEDAWLAGVWNVSNMAHTLFYDSGWEANRKPHGLLPRTRKVEEEHTHEMVFNTPECMDYWLNKNRECKEQPHDGLRPLSFFETTYAINSAGEVPHNDPGPARDDVLETWGLATIDACTVYTQSETACLVTIPIMHGRCHATSRWGCIDYNFLLRVLAVMTFARLQRTQWFLTLSREGQMFRLRVSRHKKEEVSMGDHVMVVSFSCPDRPIFVIEHQKKEEEKWKEIMHVYPAMGMPRARELQQSLLARCHRAVSLLMTTIELLHISECTITNSEACSVDCISRMKASLLPGFFCETEQGFSDHDYDHDIRPESSVIQSWRDVRRVLQRCGFADGEFESLPEY